ncbi:unnamed protein product [Camellia sinensis]
MEGERERERLGFGGIVELGGGEERGGDGELAHEGAEGGLVVAREI